MALFLYMQRRQWLWMGVSKTAAKKKAAYMVLVRLLNAPSLYDEEWDEMMWRNVLE